MLRDTTCAISAVFPLGRVLRAWYPTVVLLKVVEPLPGGPSEWKLDHVVPALEVLLSDNHKVNRLQPHHHATMIHSATTAPKQGGHMTDHVLVLETTSPKEPCFLKS